MSTLNQEQKALLNSVENEEWQSIDNVSEEIKRYQNYAKHQITKNCAILNLEINRRSKRFPQQNKP
ncbi:MAG: hypothetical protein WBM32_05760 [Crocosphaera sp.]